jgi:hypothetical protein
VLGLWPKKLDFLKYFQILTSLISFQQLDLNRHDLWNVRVDSRTKKIVKQEEHQLSLQNPWQKWHWHFSTLLNTSWKVDPENENKHYSDQLGGNEIWSNDESVNWGQYGSIKDN